MPATMQPLYAIADELAHALATIPDEAGLDTQ